MSTAGDILPSCSSSGGWWVNMPTCSRRRSHRKRTQNSSVCLPTQVSCGGGVRLDSRMPSNAEEATKHDLEQRQTQNTVQRAGHTERLETGTRLDPRTPMQCKQEKPPQQTHSLNCGNPTHRARGAVSCVQLEGP